MTQGPTTNKNSKPLGQDGLPGDDIKTRASLSFLLAKNDSQLVTNRRFIDQTSATLKSSRDLIAKFWEQFGNRSGVDSGSTSRKKFLDRD